jgi:hypothetical protein
MDGLRGAARNLSSENEPWSARDRGFLLPASTWRDPPIFKPVLPGDIGLKGRDAWMQRCQLAADLVARHHQFLSSRNCPLFSVSHFWGALRHPIWLFLLFFAAKYQPRVGCPPQTRWVFDRHASPKTAKNLAVRSCSWLFSREPGRQRIAHAWRPEITNLTAKLQVAIPILAITSRAAQALGRLFATRLKQRLRWQPVLRSGTYLGANASRVDLPARSMAPTAWQRLNPIRGSARGQP